MKTLKMLMIAIILPMLMIAGCGGSPAEVGGAMALGGATIAGIENDLRKSKDRILAEKLALVNKADLSEQEAAKLRADLDKKQITIEVLQKSAELGQKAVSTDWKDPQQAAPWLLAVLTAGYGYFKRKEGRSFNGVLQSYQKAVNQYTAEADPAEAQRLNAKLPL